ATGCSPIVEDTCRAVMSEFDAQVRSWLPFIVLTGICAYAASRVYRWFRPKAVPKPNKQFDEFPNEKRRRAD
ncbi:hypothetical protein BOX15_Mlig022667g3, partial [Macrostomum lignano]